MIDIDLVRLNFSPQSLLLLNVVLGFVMFGVSLELKADDFKEALRTPRALVIGLLGTTWCFRPAPICWCCCSNPGPASRWE